MLWNDLRQFIDRLDELGELKRVNGADSDEEIGVISELMIERGGPGLLFDEIPGYPAGYRILANVCKSARNTAIAVGIDHERTLREMGEEWEARVRGCKPIPPEVLSTGPVFENVLDGGDVNLLKFPSPKWHDRDGNRYIGTGVCVINQDPDSGFVNSGAYRVAVHDERTCGLFIEPYHHGDIIRRKYWQRGQKAPVAVSVGQEPILTILSGGSGYFCPEGVSEIDVAGYFLGAPYQVVKAPVTGLPVPATAEIVIEGFVPSPDEVVVPEGPFGEWTGYYAHGRRPETIIEVAAIYHRNDPIIFGDPPTRPVRSYSELGDIDVRAKTMLEEKGIPGIRSVYRIARPAFRVVAMTQMYDEHVDDVIRALEPGGQQGMGNRIWLLVDDDIDITNHEEVLWAIATRCIPEHGVTVVPGTAVWQLDPRIPPGERSDPDKEQGRRAYSAHNLIINACRPWAWKDEFPPVNVNSPELRERVERKWASLFQRA